MGVDADLLASVAASVGRIVAEHYPSGNSEVWLNPADWERLGRPTKVATLDAHASIGVPPGLVCVFDRDRIGYLRDPIGTPQ